MNPKTKLPLTKKLKAMIDKSVVDKDYYGYQVSSKEFRLLWSIKNYYLFTRTSDRFFMKDQKTGEYIDLEEEVYQYVAARNALGIKERDHNRIKKWLD